MTSTGVVQAQQGVVNAVDNSTQKSAEKQNAQQNSGVALGARIASELESLNKGTQSPEFKKRVEVVLRDIEKAGGKRDLESFEKYVREVAAQDGGNLESHVDSVGVFVKNGGTFDKFLQYTKDIVEEFRNSQTGGETVSIKGDFEKTVSDTFGNFIGDQPVFPFDRTFFQVFTEYVKRVAGGEGIVDKLIAEKAATASDKPASPEQAALPYVDKTI